MLQQFRKLFRCSPAGMAGPLVCAWLMLGVAPCLAAPVQVHETHDCPHCETAVVAAQPGCEIPASAVPSSSGSPDGSPVLPANYPVPVIRAPQSMDISPHFHVPVERPLRYRLCRLLE